VLKKGNVMKIRFEDLKRVIRETLVEIGRPMRRPATSGSFVITAPDGTQYRGDRDAVRVALIQHSRLTGDERNQLLSTGRANDAEIASLQRARVIVRTSPRRSVEQRPRGSGRTVELTASAAERMFQRAVKAYALNWTNFEQESPDISPDDAAPDAAAGFFDEHPEAREWARAMNMRIDHMKDSVTDYVYGAMTGEGQKR
jgi:hypothetical protein